MPVNTIFSQCINADRLASWIGAANPVTPGVITWVSNGTTVVDPYQGFSQVCQVGTGTTWIQPASLPVGALNLEFASNTGTSTVYFGTGFRPNVTANQGAILVYASQPGLTMTGSVSKSAIIEFMNNDGTGLGQAPGGVAYSGIPLVSTGSWGTGYKEVSRSYC